MLKVWHLPFPQSGRRYSFLRKFVLNTYTVIKLNNYKYELTSLQADENFSSEMRKSDARQFVMRIKITAKYAFIVSRLSDMNLSQLKKKEYSTLCISRRNNCGGIIVLSEVLAFSKFSIAICNRCRRILIEIICENWSMAICSKSELKFITGGKAI